MSNVVLEDSYVDRCQLDEKVRTALRRRQLVVIRGASKTGKSWLRQQALPNAIVIQCRLGKTAADLLVEALGALDIQLTVSRKTAKNFTGTVEASGSAGKALIVAVSAKLGLTYSRVAETTLQPIKQSVQNLQYIAELILASKRRLVIEDVHYLSLEERRTLAFDLKTLWDFSVYTVIVGVWKEQSLIDLNSDLSGRVAEFSVTWGPEDLERIIDKGSEVLNLRVATPIRQALVDSAYENAGLLQVLALSTLDEAAFDHAERDPFPVENVDKFNNAAMDHAKSLNTLYQSFAKRVSAGIRRRANSTGIYAHAMAIVLEQDDRLLQAGVPLADIFAVAHQREPRILLPNLRTAMEKIEGLQIDKDGRGLVLSYDEGRQQVHVVDLQLLLYRKYATVSWPWQAIVDEVSAESSAYALDTGAAR